MGKIFINMHTFVLDFVYYVSIRGYMKLKGINMHSYLLQI